MKCVRRNAFTLSKQGDVQPETPSSPDDAQEGVLDMVSSSQGVDLRSDTEDDESMSSSSAQLTEVQVQGIKITLSRSSRLYISMCFCLQKYRKWARAYFLLHLVQHAHAVLQLNYFMKSSRYIQMSLTESSSCPSTRALKQIQNQSFLFSAECCLVSLISSVAHFGISFFFSFQLSLFTKNNIRRVIGSVVDFVSVCQKNILN